MVQLSNEIVYNSINDLNSLDLSLYPSENIYRLLKSLNHYGIIITTLHPGKKIIRGRIHNQEEQRFNSIDELSFCPAYKNTKYQRASAPGYTMFYGSIVPEIRSNEEPNTARFTVLYEISEIVENNIYSGLQKITFSAWVVKRNIHLVTIVGAKHFKRNTLLSKILMRDFDSFISSRPSYIETSKAISEFLSYHFSRKVDNDYEYMISALYSHLAINYGFHGVMYPSVPLSGDGINVAIEPNIAEKCLTFLGASECIVKKNGKNIFVDNLTSSIILPDNKIKHVKSPYNSKIPFLY